MKLLYTILCCSLFVAVTNSQDRYLTKNGAINQRPLNIKHSNTDSILFVLVGLELDDSSMYDPNYH